MAILCNACSNRFASHQVRIWDAMTRSLLRMTRLDSPASCVDYSPDGELLVVGFGSRERSNATDPFRCIVPFCGQNCSDFDVSTPHLKIPSIFLG